MESPNQKRLGFNDGILILGVAAVVAGATLFFSAKQSSINKTPAAAAEAKKYTGIISVFRTSDRRPQTLLIVHTQDGRRIHQSNCSTVIDNCRTLGPLQFNGYVKANEKYPVEVWSDSKGLLIGESTQTAYQIELSKFDLSLKTFGAYLIGAGGLAALLGFAIKLTRKTSA